MRAIEKIERAAHLVLCVSNEGYEIDLELYKLYEFLPDKSLEPDDVRVIDETGEDYIYPAAYFISANEVKYIRWML